MITSLPAPIELLGVKVHPLTETQLLDTLVDWAMTGHRRRAYYVNAHAMNLAWEQERFRSSLNGADLVYCDGYGVKLAAAIQRYSLPDRMSIPDWIDTFLSRLKFEDSLFLVGDEEKVVETCATVMKKRHPAVTIAGWHHGFFDAGGAENEAVLEAVSRSGARILLVGMGMPRQELWVEGNLPFLDVSLVLPVGGLFRYYSGIEPRAPRWMTRNGLEWLGRLAAHPVGHFKRYVIGNPLVLLRSLSYAMSSRLAGRQDKRTDV